MNDISLHALSLQTCYTPKSHALQQCSMQAEHISVQSPPHPHRSTHSFSPDSKLNRFLILRAGQEIATSPLQRPGQYVLYETLLLLSRSQKNVLPPRLSASLSPLIITSLRRPAFTLHGHLSSHMPLGKSPQQQYS